MLKNFFSNSKLVLLLLVVMNVLIHIPMLNLPPVGAHTWRQVVGHAAAINYYEEDNSFFEPSADIRVNSEDSGVIYHEFPLTYWLTAQSYKIFGVKNWPARVIPLMFNLLLIFGAYWLCRSLGCNEQSSLLFSYFVTFSPLYLYYSASLVPNQLGLTLFLTGLSLFYFYMQRRSFGLLFYTGTMLMTMGILSKPTYLFYGLPIAFLCLYEFFKEKEIKLMVHAAISGLIIAVSNILVIRHAKVLYDDSPSIRNVHTPIGPAESPESLQQVLDNLQSGIFKWIVEMNISHAALIFFGFGIYLLYKKHPSINKLSRKFWLWWSISLVIFVSLFVVRLSDHDYYLTSSLPLVAFVSMVGANQMLNAGGKARKFAILLLCLLPISNFIRVEKRWFERTQLPVELLQNSQEIVKGIPKKDLIFVVGDSSPIVHLYYLQRKGISTRTTNVEFVDKEATLSDFQWLVHYTEGGDIPSYFNQKYQMERVNQVGKFDTYHLVLK